MDIARKLMNEEPKTRIFSCSALQELQALQWGTPCSVPRQVYPFNGECKGNKKGFHLYGRELSHKIPLLIESAKLADVAQR